jgi:hypothetical protein
MKYLLCLSLIISTSTFAESYKLSCKTVDSTKKRPNIIRCENKETVCYTTYGARGHSGISCIFKPEEREVLIIDFKE